MGWSNLPTKPPQLNAVWALGPAHQGEAKSGCHGSREHHGDPGSATIQHEAPGASLGCQSPGQAQLSRAEGLLASSAESPTFGVRVFICYSSSYSYHSSPSNSVGAHGQTSCIQCLRAHVLRHGATLRSAEHVQSYTRRMRSVSPLSRPEWFQSQGRDTRASAEKPPPAARAGPPPTGSSPHRRKRTANKVWQSRASSSRDAADSPRTVRRQVPHNAAQPPTGEIAGPPLRNTY